MGDSTNSSTDKGIHYHNSTDKRIHYHGGTHYHGYFIPSSEGMTGDPNDVPDPTEQPLCERTGTNFNPISEEKESAFIHELERIINCASLENESDTPDWILAQYLRDCMKAFTVASNSRRNWYGYPENPDANKR
jgi:hypothetical protein